MSNAVSVMEKIAPISIEIWDKKYRFKGNPDLGMAPDASIEETWKRVAIALAQPEGPKKRSSIIKLFEQALHNFVVLPAGRILAGAGTERSVTLFNCFVMGTLHDSMRGIMQGLTEGALTMQAGGGVGFDFSPIRPKGAPVRGVGASASGPLSFMDLWDGMCRTIMSAGERRGAMMATLRCDHPDIEDFIDVKRDPARLRMFNLSVLVTDAFMAAVRDDADWHLVFDGKVYKTVRAKDLWDRMMKATYDVAEPGVLFIDRINRLNPLSYIETIAATNPCVTGDTMVMTADGWRRIDSMLSDSQTIVGGDGALKRIRPAFMTGVKQTVVLTTAGGRKLRLTGDHLVMTDRGDVMARNLKRGMKVQVTEVAAVVFEANGGAVTVPMGYDTVASVEKGRVEPVYDLTEPDTHHFVANGIVVHNCGEQPLPPYGACLLGSINLMKLVKNPFTDAAHIPEEALNKAVSVAVRMLDNVIDVSRFPLQEQEDEAKAKRRIGLGVTGLGNAFAMCKERYGSARSVEMTDRWMKAVTRAAYLASADLAAEKGSFPLFKDDEYVNNPFIQALGDDVVEAIRTKGLRNGLVTSIAPTGTISLFADNVSSGLEPMFGLEYTRYVTQTDGTRAPQVVSDASYRMFRDMFGPDRPLPDYFATAMELTPEDHLAVQAAAQKWIDSSISKTINVPKDIDFGAFVSIYDRAYELGCKGCTTYRPNDVTGSILETKPAEQVPDVLPPETVPADLRQQETVIRVAADGAYRLDRTPVGWKEQRMGEEAFLPFSTRARTDGKVPRPTELPGHTYKLTWPGSDHALYININDIIENGIRRPFEIFINSKNMDHYAWTAALTRMISAVFRRGGDVGFVADELKEVFDPRGGAWMNGAYVPSILAAIGKVVETHLSKCGPVTLALPGTGEADECDGCGDCTCSKAEADQVDVSSPAAMMPASFCPKCNQPSLIRQGGCEQCTSCGWSKCG